MAGPALDDLLKKMPAIAEAVNAFQSEAVQQQAFAALVHALGVEQKAAAPQPPPPGETKEQRGARVHRRSKPSDGGTSEKKRRRRAGSLSIVKELNLMPKTKESFGDFVAQRIPKDSAYERNVLSVYYLSKVLEETPITPNHIYSCYKDQSWPVPSNLGNSLSKTAHYKGWIDSSDLDDIKLMVPGENFVEQTMAKRAAAAKGT